MTQEQKLTVGLAFTGSFCTFAKIKEVTAQLAKQNMRIVPIYSFHVQNMDTRFGTAEEFRKDIETITGEKGLCTIQEENQSGRRGIWTHLLSHRVPEIQWLSSARELPILRC